MSALTRSGTITIHTKRANHALKLVCLTLLITSLGFDRVSFRIGDSTVRLSYALYVVAFIWLAYRHKIALSRLPTLLLAGFIVLSVPSILVSANPIKSVLYAVWIVANYLLIFVVFAALARHYPHELYRGLLYSFRLQVISALVIVILGINMNETIFSTRIPYVEFNAGRAYLLYYEPSYFAIALCTYFGIIAVRVVKYGIRSCWLDLLIAGLALISTKSAFLMAISVIVFALAVLFLRFDLKTLVAAAVLGMLALVGAYVYSENGTDLIAQTLAGVLRSEDPIYYLKLRSGGRITRLECSWDVFRDHPWFGVGLGAYEAFTRTTNLTYCSQSVTYSMSEDDVTDAPPVNIYIELLATTGIFASATFFAFLLSVIFVRSWKGLSELQVAYLIGLLTMLLMMNLQSTYLMLCIWTALGVYYGTTSGKKISRAGIAAHAQALSVSTMAPTAIAPETPPVLNK